MRFHWYWPFARQEEVEWAVQTARPGESLIVQVVDRPVAPAAGVHGPVTVLRDLPDVDREVPAWRWAPSRTRTYVERAAARRRVWEREDVDLVHLHYLNRFTDAVARLPTPLVMSIHDVTPHRPRLGWAEHRLLARTYSRGDALIVHHEALRARLVEDFGLDSTVIHVVPHQVFPSPPVGPPPADAPPVLLFFGALRTNKGLGVLVEALGLMRDVDVRLVVAGRGDAEVESLARAAALADPRITAEVGFVPWERKHELFATASVVVLPYTTFASQSGVLHDAYGHDRPVVVTDVGALGRSVREDGTGLVATPGDPASLAAALREILAHSVWSRCACAAAAVRADRSPQRTGERLRTIYDHVLSPSDKRGLR